MVNRRGQLLLTAAILVSLTIVASAVLLNDIHASADVNAQQERQGLEQTERNIEQLQDSLRELFMVNGSEERIPYVDDTDKLANATEEYVQQYLNVSTRNTVQFVDVELFGSGPSGSGEVFIQNETRNFTKDSGNSPLQIAKGDELTYMHFDITSVQSGGSLKIQAGSDWINISKSSGETVIKQQGKTVCTVEPVNSESPLEIEVFNGNGVVTYDGTVCGNLEFGKSFNSSKQWLQINTNSNANSTGTFVVAIENANSTGSNKWDDPGKYRYNESGIVNPKFRITYEDPQVSYETNVTAYGGGS